MRLEFSSRLARFCNLRFWVAVMACVATTAPLLADDWDPVTPQDRALAPTPDYRDAVIMFDRGTITTEASGMTFQRYLRMKVFSERGVGLVSSLPIDYLYYDHLFNVRGRIIRDTSVMQVSDKRSTSIVEKGERRICRFSIPGLKPGDVFEIQYEIAFYGGFDRLGPESFFLFNLEHSYDAYRVKTRIQSDIDEHGQAISMRNIPTWFFDHPIYCLESQFVARIGAGYDYVYIPVNVPYAKMDPVMDRIQIITATAYKQYTWRLEHIRAYTRREGDKEYSELDRSALHFNRFSTVDLGQNRMLSGVYAGEYWPLLGQDIQGYLTEYMKVTSAMRKQFSKVVTRGDTSSESIARICTYLKRQYTFDSTGYYLRPEQQNLQHLFKKKHGMPFEINLMMLAMLQHAGFKAWPVLINTNDRIPFQRSGKFNHMLVMIREDGRNRFLDITSRNGSCDELPMLCKVKRGVCVNFDKSGIIDVCPEESTNP